MPFPKSLEPLTCPGPAGKLGEGEVVEALVLWSGLYWYHSYVASGSLVSSRLKVMSKKEAEMEGKKQGGNDGEGGKVRERGRERERAKKGQMEKERGGNERGREERGKNENVKERVRERVCV